MRRPLLIALALAATAATATGLLVLRSLRDSNPSHLVQPGSEVVPGAGVPAAVAAIGPLPCCRSVGRRAFLTRVSVEPPVIHLEQGDLEWERTLSHIPGVGAERAQSLFAALHTLPEEALGHAAQAATDALPDHKYASVALPVLLSVETHGSVLSVLFADLLERPDSLTLPALMKVARQPRHPFADAARDHLALLTSDAPTAQPYPSLGQSEASP